MCAWVKLGPRALGQVPVVVLVAAFLFNLGQGVLRPTLPLYLQQVFAANYQMVTLIPVVFGVGKWVASLPTGYALDLLGRQHLMAAGLLLIALCDVGSVLAVAYGVFLGFRAVAGAGWAMFGTVATVIAVDRPRGQRRGRAVSLLLMSETLGLLVGSNAGGWMYQSAGRGEGYRHTQEACSDQQKGREPEPHGRAYHPFDQLLRKEDDEPQSDAKEGESDDDVHRASFFTTVRQSCRRR